VDKKTIEFGELRISSVARNHVEDCLNKNWVSMGEKVRLFENKWSDTFNYPHTVMFSSGTSANQAALMSLDLEPGAEVLCPALSFIATANSIRAAGYTPVFVDVDKETLNISKDEIVNTFSKYSTKAIMGVNLMGKPCCMDVLSDLASSHHLPFIIDNCEAYGCSKAACYSLDFADMETTSHYIAHIICCGEGGTVSAKTQYYKDKLKSVRSHGREPDSVYFDHQRFGLNLKPSDLHASIGLGEIDNFIDIFTKRKANIQAFRNAVVGYENKAYFVEEDRGDINAPHGFSITLKEEFANEDNIMLLTSILQGANIHWKRNFGSMPHHKAFKYLGYSKDSMPNARYIGKYGIHIGCHYWLTDEDIDYVCHYLKFALEILK